MRNLTALALAALLVPALAGLGPAQSDPDLLRRIERQLRDLDSTYRLTVPKDQPISERLLIDYGGALRFGLLSADDRDGNTRLLRQSNATVYLSAELDGAHQFFGRANILYNDFNAGESFDGDGDELEEPIVDIYWYSFDLAAAHLARTGRYLGFNVNVKAGRQFVNWGSGLALSSVLYAGLAEVEVGPFSIEGLAGMTPTTGTIDFDGSRPSFDTNTQRRFFGARVAYLGSTAFRPYVSVLVQKDHNERDFAVISTANSTYPTRFSYDSEYYAVGSSGALGSQFTYRAELVYERGHGLSRPLDLSLNAISQTREGIEAWAGVLTLSYLVQDLSGTRVDMEFLAGSGDKDRLDAGDTFGGNLTGTIDRSFNALGYVDTGLALGPEVSNLLSAQLTVSTSPPIPGLDQDALRLRVSGFLFGKLDDGAPLNVPTTEHRFVGGEIDTTADLRITSDLTATVRYGIFLDGPAIPRGQDDPTHFGYIGVSYAF